MRTKYVMISCANHLTRRMGCWGRLLPVVFIVMSALPLSSQIVNIEEQRITGTNDSIRWYGSVRAGASLAKIQDEILQLNGTAHVQYKFQKTLVLALLDFRFLRAGEQDFNRAAFSHVRYNRDLSERLVFEAFGQAQYNKLLLIELRALAGSGLRYRLFRSGDGQQRIYAGLAYLYETDHYLNEAEDQQLHRMSSYLSFTFRPWEGVKLVHTTYWQPKLVAFENYRLSMEWRLDMPLGRKISFYTDFTYGIDQSLPEDAPTSTFNWINGLTFRF